MKRITMILILVAFSAGSCSRRHVTTHDNRRIEKDGSLRMGSSAHLYFGDEEATLDYAADLLRSQKYAEATKAYQSVLDQESAEAQYREQALLGLAQVHSSLLNPQKDFSLALSLLQRLVSEYPQSALRERAEQRAREIRQLMADQ
jgi:outer membrane protein assembly factor BamD (BamD/ComL family)